MIRETYAASVKETSLSVVQTKIDSIRRKSISKTGFRVYRDGYIGTAGAIGAYDEERLEEQASYALKNKIAYPFDLSGTRSESFDGTAEIVPENEMIAEFEAMLGLLKEQQPEFSFSNKISVSEIMTTLVNERGLDLSYRDSLIDVALLFKERKSANIMDGFIVCEGRTYERIMLLRFINEICDAYKNKVKLPSGEKLPVIFATRDVTPLTKLMQDLNGSIFGSKSSLLSDKMGKLVFHEGFSLLQSRNPKDEILPFFDAEGVVNDDYRFPLIENGIIRAPYTDKRIADQYGLELTGSAVSEYDGVPVLGPTNFRIEESSHSTASLLDGRKAVFVWLAMGGDFTPQGKFATPVQLSFLFDGKRFLGRLPELSLSSSVFDMFGPDYVGVGKNPYSLMSNDRCLVMEMNVFKN